MALALPLAPPPAEEQADRQAVGELKEVVFEARVVVHEALHLPILRDTQYVSDHYMYMHANAIHLVM